MEWQNPFCNFDVETVGLINYAPWTQHSRAELGRYVFDELYYSIPWKVQVNADLARDLSHPPELACQFFLEVHGPPLSLVVMFTEMGVTPCSQIMWMKPLPRTCKELLT